MTKSTSGGCDQFETSPEGNDQELRTAFCERRQTDRLKTNYRIDESVIVPIIKDKNKRVNDKNNYRPICLSNICSKIIEVVICNRTGTFL